MELDIKVKKLAEETCKNFFKSLPENGKSEVNIEAFRNWMNAKPKEKKAVETNFIKRIKNEGIR